MTLNQEEIQLLKEIAREENGKSEIKFGDLKQAYMLFKKKNEDGRVEDLLARRRLQRKKKAA